MGRYREKSVYMQYIYIAVGTGIVSFAIKCIYEPNSLVVGGFSGLAIIIKSLTEGLVKGGIPLWMTNIVLNVPVFLAALKVKGKGFIGKTLFATAMVSVWLGALPEFSFIKDNLLLAALFGGALQGVGMGIVFSARATTGGTDMVGAIIQNYLRHFSVARIMMVIDAAIVIAGGYIFGLERALYAIITIVVVNRIADAIIEGLKFAKAAYIITDKYEEVSEVIMHEIDRGLTGIYAKGMYTRKDRCLLFCVVTKKELVHLKELVGKIDENAFIIVSDAREVMGEGFFPVE
ncbi:YitT family protein [Luxibacter massiliensis]|uniref:YitT family protein n=1 Tax=Luxibacter massiliensis TaxID=2219695 RepID=UPI000F053950|nr:YitT family protein [Luxibacter massiliensis]